MDRTAQIAARVSGRVAESHRDSPLDRLLAEDIAGNDLTSLLLHAFRQRALRRTFVEVAEHGARLAMTHPSEIDARKVHAFDGAAFAAASAFAAIELSPVEPLGAAACSGVDPNNVLATLRFGEVAGDPTTALALRARAIRASGRTDPIRLCASQRVLRMQPVDQLGFSAHFRLFGLATALRAERASDDDRAERRALLEQLEVWTALFAALGAGGFAPASVRVVLSDTRVVRAALRERGADPDQLSRAVAAHRPASTEAALASAGIVLPRAAENAIDVATQLGLGARERAIVGATLSEVAERLSVPASFDFGRLQGLSYYDGPVVQIVVAREDGAEFSLGDGGALPWLTTLLSDRRERFVASGVGSELYLKLFSR